MCGCSRPSTRPRQPSTPVGTTPRTCAACWQMTLPGTCPGAARSPVTITVARKSWAISAPAGPTPRATFRVLPRAILADDQQAVHLAGGQLERDGQLRTWQTVGVFRIAGGKIAECWLVPFDQYLFDELWS
jgi:hypothetical protein